MVVQRYGPVGLGSGRPANLRSRPRWVRFGIFKPFRVPKTKEIWGTDGGERKEEKKKRLEKIEST